MALTRTARVACFTSFATLGLLAACSPDMSPNTYNASAVQQANKVEQGVVVGVRQVDVQVAGTTGALAGAAAGGIAGSQLGGSSATQALGSVGGGLIGSLIGSGVEKAAGDTKGYEYIVRKPNGDLVSVTQVDVTPMALGQRVLVIAGSQARIVPDYTTAPPEKPKAPVPSSAAIPAAGVSTPTMPLHPTPDALSPAPIEKPLAAPAPAPAPTPTPAPATTPLPPPAATAEPTAEARPAATTTDKSPTSLALPSLPVMP